MNVTLIREGFPKTCHKYVGYQAREIAKKKTTKNPKTKKNKPKTNKEIKVDLVEWKIQEGRRKIRVKMTKSFEMEKEMEWD